ncbi:hypothetical protein [Sphingobacterium kyonggiense]|uniref:hypothetical protein n=1 Tax=Sphingobacterium kyonggiense TaxID=714075 RepID=UPI003CD0B9C1
MKTPELSLQPVPPAFPNPRYRAQMGLPLLLGARQLLRADRIKSYRSFRRNGKICFLHCQYHPVGCRTIATLYGILGQSNLEEKTLDFLNGYMGNKPIRIGNQASVHIQNDLYGQAMIALLPLFTDYRFRHQNKGLASQWTRFVLQKMEISIQANSKREHAIEHIESCYDDQRKGIRQCTG